MFPDLRFHSGFLCNSRMGGLWSSTEPCVSPPGTISFTALSITTLTLLGGSTSAFTSTKLYTQPKKLSNFQIYAYAITIQSLSSSPRPPSTTSIHRTPSTTPVNSNPTHTSPIPPNSTHGLPAKDIAGIALGVALPCLGILIGFLVCWHLRHHRTPKQRVREESKDIHVHGLNSKHELDAKIPDASTKHLTNLTPPTNIAELESGSRELSNLRGYT